MIACLLAIATIAAAQQPPHAHPPATPPAAQKPAPQKPTSQKPTAEDHSAHELKAADKPKEPIPPITDADRAAAFPADMHGHTVHDRELRYFFLFDQLEWQGSGAGGANLENTSWIGGDINRLWLRAEGESDDGRVENAFVHALWGHSFSRWWDVVAGIRQDFRPGDPQTWAAVGIQGLAPYWFEIEATGYVGSGGRTHARLEAEYDLLLTNRLILQPLAELELYGKSDRARGLGAGLSSLETGLRLRYEFRREFAPYAGVIWHRKFFGTAAFARNAGEEVSVARFAFGIRTWF